MAWSIAFQANRYPIPKLNPEPLIREGLLQADRLLAQRPSGAPKSGLLLEILGQVQDARGADPAESYQQAFATARDGLERNPNNPTLLSWALQSVQALLVHEGGLGKDIEPTWTLAKDWAERFRALYPERPFAFFRYASLLIERAEIGRRQGQDPRTWLESAQEACRAAERLKTNGADVLRPRQCPGSIGGSSISAQDSASACDSPCTTTKRGSPFGSRGMDPGNRGVPALPGGSPNLQRVAILRPGSTGLKRPYQKGSSFRRNGDSTCCGGNATGPGPSGRCACGSRPGPSSAGPRRTWPLRAESGAPPKSSGGLRKCAWTRWLRGWRSQTAAGLARPAKPSSWSRGPAKRRHCSPHFCRCRPGGPQVMCGLDRPCEVLGQPGARSSRPLSAAHAPVGGVIRRSGDCRWKIGNNS